MVETRQKQDEKNLMKKENEKISIALFIAMSIIATLGFHQIAHATMSGPIMLDEFSLNLKENEIQFIEYNCTHQTSERFKYSLKTGKIESLGVFQGSTPEAECPLKPLDLNKMDVNFIVELDSIYTGPGIDSTIFFLDRNVAKENTTFVKEDETHWDQLEKRFADTYLPDPSRFYNWKVTPVFQEKSLSAKKIGACDTSSGVCFSGLSYPGCDFVLIIARTTWVCDMSGGI